MINQRSKPISQNQSPNPNSKFRFRDDPILWIREFLLSRRQRVVRQAIYEKWGGDVDPRIHWIIDVDGENEGLSQNQQEFTAQKFYLANLDHFAAERFHNWRTYLHYPIVFVLALASAYSVHWAKKSPHDIEFFVWMFWLFFATVIATVTLWGNSFVWRLFFPPRFVIPEEVAACEDMLERCVFRTFPKETPKDLADRFRILATDKQGDSTAGQLMAIDLERSSLDKQVIETQKFLSMGAACIVWPIFLKMPLTAVIIAVVATIFFY